MDTKLICYGLFIMLIISQICWSIKMKKQWKDFLAYKRNVQAGVFFVRLESVDESKKIDLIIAIKNNPEIEIANNSKITLKRAKDMVDTVRFGSMCIVANNINEKTAHQIKQTIEFYGGTAVVVDNTPVL